MADAGIGKGGGASQVAPPRRGASRRVDVAIQSAMSRLCALGAKEVYSDVNSRPAPAATGLAEISGSSQLRV